MNISLSQIVGWIFGILGVIIIIAFFVPSFGVREPFGPVIQLVLGIGLAVLGVVIARGGVPRATG